MPPNPPLLPSNTHVHVHVHCFTTCRYDATQLPGFEWMEDVPKLHGNQLVYIGLRDVDHKE
jgi:hypothetical protein